MEPSVKVHSRDGATRGNRASDSGPCRRNLIVSETWMAGAPLPGREGAMPGVPFMFITAVAESLRSAPAPPAEGGPRWRSGSTSERLRHRGDEHERHRV